MWQAVWRLKDVCGRQRGQVDPKQSQSQEVFGNVCVWLRGRRGITWEVNFVPDCVSARRCCSVAKSFWLCDPTDCSTSGSCIHQYVTELAHTHAPWVGGLIQPSHPLLSPSPLALSLSQHQGLFQWVSSSHQAAKVMELQLQHQSFQWIFRTDFL